MLKKPDSPVYKTPLKKLALYFESSRDKWKARSGEKQKRIDYLETKVRDLKKSRTYWKNYAKELQEQLGKKKHRFT